MNNDIFFAYSMFQLILLVLDVYIFLKTGRDIARKGEYTWFSVLIAAHMVYLAFSSIWTLHEYDLLEMPENVMMFVCTLSLWAVTNCATAVFMFVVEKLRLKAFQNGVGRKLRYLPALISTILILTNPWTGLVFTISEEGFFTHQRLYIPTLAVASIYLLMIAGLGVANMVRARTSFQRDSNRTLFISVLVIIVVVLVDGLLTKASILPAAVFAVIVVIFINMLESNINADALTGMNNRRKAGEYLSDKLLSVSPEDPVYLYMGDLNRFKQINDAYGHLEGDEALILCSRALKRAIAGYNGFAARYGGDEFLMSWQPGKGKKKNPELLVKDVEKLLKEQSEGKPYQLSMTLGYVRCEDPKLTLNEYIRRADEMLYQRKTSAR